jgi:hypothetical protein
MHSNTNILYLTDIHFGAESTSKVTSTQVAQREIVLSSLLSTLEKIPPDWVPNIIAISGDIGWKGRETDYDLARIWLQTLLHQFGLTSESLLMCVGNHDINRLATLGMEPPTTTEKADEWLKLESIVESENFTRPFAAYANFSDNFGIPMLSIGNTESNLMASGRSTEYALLS